MSYMNLSKDIKNHLYETIIPFWEGLKDEEFGGYYGLLDFDLNLDKKAVKGCILNSRILWFFSNGVTRLGDKELLPYADHAFDFMKKYCFDKENGGVYWSLNYDGSVDDSTKHTYNQAFAIYALSSYYEASGNEEAKELALKLYELIESRCRDEKGYLEAFTVDFKPESNEKLSENGVIATRTMNTLLHVFEAYTELYRVTKEEKVVRQLKEMLDRFYEDVYNKDRHRLEVFFNDSYESLIDLHSYGHDIEAAWLIDRGLEVLKGVLDREYVEKIAFMTADIAQNVFHLAYDGKSLVCENEKGVDNQLRIWWVQCEAMIGFYNEYQKDGNKKDYADGACRIWEYVKDHLVDKRPGSEWLSEVDENAVPATKKPIVEPWKCPYHNGRMCYEMIERIAE